MGDELLQIWENRVGSSLNHFFKYIKEEGPSRIIAKREKMKNGLRKASVTIECSLVLPLFLFFSIEVFSVFDMLSAYVRMQSVLGEVAIEAATVLSLTDEEPDEAMSLVISETLIREEITRKAGLKWLAKSPIIGGAAGLHLFRCDLATDQKSVKLVLTYRVKPWISIGNVGKMTLVNSCKVNVWKGFEKQEDEKAPEEFVYVTQTGEAYHLYSDCSYLIADSKAVSGADLAMKRNRNGEKYYACDLCCKGLTPDDGQEYYITPWGSRFHANPVCRALIKNVKAIPQEEIGLRHLCSKCAARAQEEKGE